jgi:hypothetical protein
VYADTPPPYDAKFLYYTQSIVHGASLHIDKILIEYPDGSQVDLTDQVDQVITPHVDEMWYIEDHVEQRKACLKASWTIRQCITQRGSFVFVISGTLRRGNKVLEQVDTRLRCDPFGETQVFSTWYWWIVSQA